MRFNLKESFPLFTSRKIFFKGVFEELIFFLRGDTNSKNLEDKGVKIWKDNTSREFLNKIGLECLPEGEIGCGYSHQWRNFNGEHKNIPDTKGLVGFDQVKDVISKLKNNPLDRRIIINAWCPNQLKYMALPPCHIMYIFNVNPKLNQLNCQMTQRSVDSTLGLSFNIASLALLTCLMAKVSGLEPGEIYWTGVDCHIYKNHIDGVKEQIKRKPFNFPTLDINKNIKTIEDIENLQFNDIEIKNYKHHDPIKFEMAV
jgi:thymidylate synthase